MDKKTLYISIISFFAYSGYYVGLAIMIAFNFSDLSRFYSVPLRVFLCIVMTILIFKGKVNSEPTTLRIITAFTILYIFKVLYTENTILEDDVLPTSKVWYEYVFYFLAFNLLPFLSYSAVDFNRYKEVILNSIIFSGFLLALLSIFLYKDLLVEGIGRISEAKYNNSSVETLSPLALSYSGVLTITLCMFKLIFQKNIKLLYNIYIYSTITLSFIIFFLGATRGSFVSLVLCVIALISFGTVKNKIGIVALVIISIPLIIYGAETTGSDIFKRTNNSIESGDTSGREPLWNASLKEFMNNPLLGGRVEVSGIYPHNIFLETLMATGIIGFIFLLIIICKFVYKSIRYIKHDINYIIPFIIFINGISQYLFTGSICFSILIFIPFGILSEHIKSSSYKINNCLTNE